MNDLEQVADVKPKKKRGKRWKPGCVFETKNGWYFRSGHNKAALLGWKDDIKCQREAWIKAIPLLCEANGVPMPEEQAYKFGSAHVEKDDDGQYWELKYVVRNMQCEIRVCTVRHFPTQESAEIKALPLIRRLERGDWKSLIQQTTTDAIGKPNYCADDYSEKLVSQDGKCAICGDEPKRMDWDHDHSTGELRDLLCGHCNRAIGSLRDDPVRCEAAAAYLRRHGK